MTTKLAAHERPAFYNAVRAVRLGDVAQSMKNGIYKSKDAYADEGVACLRMYNIGDGRIIWRDIKRMTLSELERTEYGLEPGDLLVNRVNSRELVGKTALVPPGIERCVFESKNIRVRLDRNLVEPAYVNYALLALGRAHFNQNAQQVVGMASVSQPQVAAFQFLLRPVAQQREVVAYLDEQLSRLDASVAALHRVQANLKRYRASVLKSACEGRLVPTEAELTRQEGRDFETGAQLLNRILASRRTKVAGRVKSKDPMPIDCADDSAVPEGWTSAYVCQLGVVTTGFTPSTADPANFDGDVPFFKPTDLDAGYFTREARQTLSLKGLSSGRLLPRGSVLVTCIGATIGKAGLAQVDCATNQQINAITVEREHVLAEYLFWFMSSPDSQRAIRENASSTTLPILNKSKFERLTVPLPPLAEQHRIVAEADRRLSLIRAAEAQVAANLARAQRLRQSILQAAFRTPAQAGQ
ncbi:MAG: restriction endonuclease subunit S [Pseudomonadota bacterium]